VRIDVAFEAAIGPAARWHVIIVLLQRSSVSRFTRAMYVKRHKEHHCARALRSASVPNLSFGEPLPEIGVLTPVPSHRDYP
jgi:hypothetical protein